jgi:hypothetical protein
MTDIVEQLRRYAGSVCLSTPTELAAADEIEQLRAELKFEEQRIADLMSDLGEASTDAARYRWLREEHNVLFLPVAHVIWKRNGDRLSSEWVNTGGGDDLDQHIDAAIAAAPKPGDPT